MGWTAVRIGGWADIDKPKITGIFGYYPICGVGMPVLTVNKAKEKPDTILEEVQNLYEPRLLQNSGFVRSSIPGMKDSIIAGMKEKVEGCSTSVEW